MSDRPWDPALRSIGPAPARKRRSIEPDHLDSGRLAAGVGFEAQAIADHANEAEPRFRADREKERLRRIEPRVEPAAAALDRQLHRRAVEDVAPGQQVELRFAEKDGLAGGTDVSGLSSWQDWYGALEKAHDELTQQCDAVIVGGMSAGSMLALRLAALRPEKIHGLMLFSPTLWPNGWAIPWYFSLFRLVNDKWAARLFKFRARAPHGIKDDRLRSFILDSVQSEADSIEDLFARGICLPSSSSLTPADQDRVIEAVRSACRAMAG